MSLEFRIAPPPQRCVSSTTISTASFHNPSQRPQPHYCNNQRKSSTQSASGHYYNLDRGSESGSNVRDKPSWINASAHQQKGFESAFRSAIERMRLSSESRLEMMGKETSSSTSQLPTLSSNIRQNVRVSSSQLASSGYHNKPDASSMVPQPYIFNTASVRIPTYGRSTSTSNFTSGTSPWEMGEHQPENSRPVQNAKQPLDPNVNQVNGQPPPQRQTSSTYVQPTSSNRPRSESSSHYSATEDPSGVYDNLDNYSRQTNQESRNVTSDARAATLNMHKPQQFGRFESPSSNSTTTGQSSSLTRESQSHSVRIPIRHQSVSDMYSTLPNMNSAATGGRQWFDNDSTSFASGGTVSVVESNSGKRVVSQTEQLFYSTSAAASSQSHYATVSDKKTSENGASPNLYSSRKPSESSVKQVPEKDEKDTSLPSVKEIIRQVEAITKEVESSSEVAEVMPPVSTVAINGVSMIPRSVQQSTSATRQQAPQPSPSSGIPPGSASPRITSSTTIQHNSSSQNAQQTSLSSIRKGAESRSSLNHLPGAATLTSFSSQQRKSSDPTVSRKSVQLPSDYQRLREAFVEQRNEIQRLRRELLSKEKSITCLQNKIQQYEQYYGPMDLEK